MPPQPRSGARRRRIDVVDSVGPSGLDESAAASGPKTPRAISCSWVCTVSPLQIGATGIRSNDASSMISCRRLLRQPGTHDLVPLVEAHQAAGELGELLVLACRSGRSIMSRKSENCCREFVQNPT